MKTSHMALILGAGSDIARATAHEYARAGFSLILGGRKSERFKADAADLTLRYKVDVIIREFDVLDISSHSAFLDNLPELPHSLICAVGLLGDQNQSAEDAQMADLIIRSNFIGPALFMGDLASRMEKRGSGFLIGISSVAGDRGRASNYIYGAAKSGFTAFLSGLRNRLAKKGVRVITVKPGFVRTQMTEGMKLPNLLTAEPIEVAQAIFNAEQKGKDVVYVRPIWYFIMTIIRVIPECVFKKLSL